MLVAKDWGLTPDQFWESSRISKAFMIAQFEVSGIMQNLEMKTKI